MGAVTIDDEIRFVERLERDFPGMEFRWGCQRFSYREIKSKKTVFLGQPQPNFGLLALHEVGHGLSGHKDYKTLIQRLKNESEAWERAKTLLLQYRERTHSDEQNKIPIWDEEFVQTQLDTYREWIHTKTQCKKCGLTMYQTGDSSFHCPRCESFS